MCSCRSSDCPSSRLDVNYRNSTEASQRLESNTTTASRLHGNNTASASVEIEGEEVAESENDMDESESEVVWSDTDF